MSRKNNLKPFLINGSTPQSLAASFTSPITLIPFTDNVSYQINITTSNSQGTFKVQVSDDYNMDETTNTLINPGTWSDLPVGPGTVAGANDSIIFDLNQLPFNAVRLAYTSTTAGTGSCNMYITHRQLGG